MTPRRPRSPAPAPKTAGLVDEVRHAPESCSTIRSSSTRRHVKAGQTVWVRAVAQDRRQLDLPELKLGPQESATPWQQIHIVAAEAKAKADLAQLESLRTALARILQDQLRARAAAAGLPRSSTEAEAGTLAADIRGQQLAVQKAATAVIESIGATDDPERLTIKRVVEQAGLRRDGPGRPAGRGPGNRSSSWPSWPSRRPS